MAPGSSPNACPPPRWPGSRPSPTSSAPWRSGRVPTPTPSATPSAAAGSTRPTDHGGLTLHAQRPGPAAAGDGAAGHRHVAGGLRVRRHGDGPGERARPHRELHDHVRPRTRPRPGPVLPAGVRRPGGHGAVGLAVRRAPRVGVAPGRRRRRRRVHAVVPRRRPGLRPAARLAAAPARGAGGHRARPDALARHSPGRAGAAAAEGAGRHHRRQPHHAVRGRPGALRSSTSGGPPSTTPSSRRGCRRPATPSTTSRTSPRTSTPSSRSPPRRRAFPPPSSTPSSGSSCGSCSRRTSTGCPRRSA